MQTSAYSEFSLSGPCPRVFLHQASKVNLLSNYHLPQASSCQRLGSIWPGTAKRTLLGQGSATQWTKMAHLSSITNCWPWQLLNHTSSLLKSRLGISSLLGHKTWMAEVEQLEPQLPQRTVQIIEGKKMRLGSMWKDLWEQGPLLEGREVCGRHSRFFKHTKVHASMDDLDLLSSICIRSKER